MLTAADIKQHALQIGFDLVGIAPASASKDLEFLPRWLQKGYAGELHYLADPRRQDPRRVLPTVQSVICAGLIYNTRLPYSTGSAGDAVSSETGRTAPARAWISRYAWGKDYHQVLRDKLEQLRTFINRCAAEAETRVYVDTGPVTERAFARLSGIGWMGKNTCVINEQKGSWFFLGVILTDLRLELDLPAPDRCGSCTRCLEACPTGALAEPYMMDASRCISYFNIELKGTIPEEFRTRMGTNVFGCDICQDVCPWNGGDSTAQRRVATTDRPEFQPLSVTENRPADAGETTHFSLYHPPLAALAAMTEEDFKRAFAHSPIKRAKYRGWLRNLCVAMGNSRDRSFLPWLEAAANHPDAVVREHASWARRKLQGN